jgi:hypothetical protein
MIERASRPVAAPLRGLLPFRELLAERGHFLGTAPADGREFRRVLLLPHSLRCPLPDPPVLLVQGRPVVVVILPEGGKRP